MRELGKYLNIEKNRYQKFMAIDVNEALKALANPMRLAILNWLKDPRTAFPEQEVDPETVGVCVSIIQARTGLSQSTTSLYLAALQRAQLVTSQRIGPWTYYKRHDENIDAFFKALQERI
ncbi:ArsR/SmtB family transcription factor [Aeromonas simiae]|uniref:ArsR/SmtB family transcription factor n=1 Tax=Aeromonas simiae TaxID=218936 RepID=UPI00384C978C